MNNAFAKNNKEQELLLVVYENLLEALEKSKTKTDSSIRAKFFIDIESQIRNFEKEHPEFIFEYYYEKEYEYNE